MSDPIKVAPPHLSYRAGVIVLGQKGVCTSRLVPKKLGALCPLLLGWGYG